MDANVEHQGLYPNIQTENAATQIWCKWFPVYTVYWHTNTDLAVKMYKSVCLVELLFT
jgi:hypothetical protein